MLLLLFHHEVVPLHTVIVQAEIDLVNVLDTAMMVRVLSPAGPLGSTHFERLKSDIAVTSTLHGEHGWIVITHDDLLVIQKGVT